MNEEIEKLLKELNCITYKFDKNNLIYKNSFFSSDIHLMYKELINITSELNSLNIKFKIDVDNNIIIIT